MKKQWTAPTFLILLLIMTLSIALPGIPASVSADVLFVHDYELEEYLLGKQQNRTLNAYDGERLYIDNNIRYTGSWMKRIFGKEKEERETLHILLDQDRVREFDWFRCRITNYPLEKLSDVEGLKESAKQYQGADEILDLRYSVKKPILQIKVSPQPVEVLGYTCTHVKAELTLETEDIKKNAKSITHVIQNLWVSQSVPGFDQYQTFQDKLAKRLGLESERMGALTYILRYWQGSLAPVKEKLNKVVGYPVKSQVTVHGTYVENLDSETPKESKLAIKKETMVLTSVNLDDVDPEKFKPDVVFGEKTVQ